MVNLKNMVSKVKAALTGADAVGADNMEAQVLQALQNQDFEAAFAALPQQAEALLAVWLKQLAAVQPACAQKIEAFLRHEGAAIEAMNCRTMWPMMCLTCLRGHWMILPMPLSPAMCAACLSGLYPCCCGCNGIAC